MTYQIKASHAVIYVKTSGRISSASRHDIVDEIIGKYNDSQKKFLIIDHSDATIEVDAKESSNLGEKIGGLPLLAPNLNVIVIATGETRAIVDVSVVVARHKGLSIQVCESQNEAIMKMT